MQSIPAMGSQVSPWLLWKPPMEATRGSRQWKPPSPVVGVGVSVRLSHHSNHLLLGLPLGRIATATKQATPAAVAPVTAQRRVGLQRPSTRGRLWWWPGGDVHRRQCPPGGRPGVFRQGGQGNAGGLGAHKHRRQQRLHALAGPRRGGKIVLQPHDVLHGGSDAARLASLFEWECPKDHEVQDYTHSPNIEDLAIVVGVDDAVAQQHLGGTI
mmetsp:Transcript_15802/g.47588  ORF Transcript_15802/g.47588 Transcript_15802/m.47588 type:complete len:212 (-) Transcript_15802:890-1525(-)